MITFKPTFKKLATRARDVFVTRDFLLHDGANLRRFSIAGRTQAAFAGVAAVALGFSAYGAGVAAHGLVGETADATQQITQLEAQMDAMEARVVAMRVTANAHAARIEQRQALIAAALTGKADRSKIANAGPAIDAETEQLAADVARRFARVEQRQALQAEVAHKVASARLTATATQLRRMGVRPERVVAKAMPAMGGPFEAAASTEASADVAADAQFKNLFMTWKKLDTLEQAVIAIPSLQPVDRLTFTSNFGVRSDPFRGVAAMHAGVDIPGPIGTPIYATADGFVMRAERSGGYGNLVELDHGKGIATRYGHLSKILVSPYERVRRGQLIALMGSTGRSTGSHLHYEVRMDGHAVNPIPFLQTADYLLGVQDRALKAQTASISPIAR